MSIPLTRSFNRGLFPIGDDDGYALGQINASIIAPFVSGVRSGLTPPGGPGTHLFSIPLPSRGTTLRPLNPPPPPMHPKDAGGDGLENVGQNEDGAGMARIGRSRFEHSPCGDMGYFFVC